MFKKEVINHFGKSIEVCRVLGLTSGSVSQWGNLIPEKQAMRLERITAGKLKYSSALYKKAA
jgi:DNA-binding transcriptional regulator YdaS (Cro superfamily)